MTCYLAKAVFAQCQHRSRGEAEEWQWYAMTFTQITTQYAELRCEILHPNPISHARSWHGKIVHAIIPKDSLINFPLIRDATFTSYVVFMLEFYGHLDNATLYHVK